MGVSAVSYVMSQAEAQIYRDWTVPASVAFFRDPPKQRVMVASVA
ncbi:uncharacterized protein METZ01_LOCUS481212 [marine metagenome]|uniref:Uncharacterized protein n=1 Tax=marine metagenome TaxID=408172 RepID=A0A383C9U1_9ZZZZ